jgi:hypothetical protein
MAAPENYVGPLMGPVSINSNGVQANSLGGQPSLSPAPGAALVGQGLSGFNNIFANIRITAAPTGGSPILDVWLQTAFGPQSVSDANETWQDLAHVQFTTGLGYFVISICGTTFGPSAPALSQNQQLPVNQVVQGPWGSKLRLAWKFTGGGSAGNYTLQSDVVID